MEGSRSQAGAGDRLFGRSALEACYEGNGLVRSPVRADRKAARGRIPVERVAVLRASQGFRVTEG